MKNIYIITNKINGKQYVGQTSKDIHERFSRHCKCAARTNMLIHNAILKFGKSNFSVSLLKIVPDNEWQYWETYFIKLFNTHYTCGGYNITWGGYSNPMDIELCKKRHSDAIHTEQYRCKQRESHNGFRHTESSKLKMSYIQKQVSKRPDWIKKNRLVIDKKKKPIYMMDDSFNILKEFDCVTSALSYLGAKYLSCTNVITKSIGKFRKNGKPRKAYGYIWRYKDK